MAITVNEAIKIEFNADMASLNTALTKAKVATAKAVDSINKSLSSIKKTALTVAKGVGVLGVAFSILIGYGIKLNAELDEFRGTSDTLTKTLNDMAIKSKSFITAISSPFYIALSAGMKEVNSLIGKYAPKAMAAMESTMRSVAKGMVTVIGFVIKSVNGLVDAIKLAWNGLNQLWEASKQILPKAAKGILGVGSSIAGFIAPSMKEGLQELTGELNAWLDGPIERSKKALKELAAESDGLFKSNAEFNLSIDSVVVKINEMVDSGKSFKEIYEEALKDFKAMGIEAPKATKLATKAAKEATETAARWKTELTEIGQLYIDIGSEISGQFTNMFVDWQEGALDFGATMRNVLNNIAAQIFEMAVSKQIGGFITNLLGSSFGGTTTTSLAGIDVSMFARGGVVNSPTAFPMASGVGIMGEAGAEAILPLTRMGGDLGVKAEASPVNVNVMNYGNDNVQVEQSDGNINVIISQIAQSISRGTGDIGNAIEGRYGIRKQ